MSFRSKLCLCMAVPHMCLHMHMYIWAWLHGALFAWAQSWVCALCRHIKPHPGVCHRTWQNIHHQRGPPPAGDVPVYAPQDSVRYAAAQLWRLHICLCCMTGNRDSLEKQYCCHELIVFALPRADCTLQNFHIHTGTAPLRLDLTLAENGVQHQQTLHCHPRLLGGAGGRRLAPAYPPQQQPIRFQAVSSIDEARPLIVQLLHAAHNQATGGCYLALWALAADNQREALQLWDVVRELLDLHPYISGVCTDGPIQNR